MPQRGQVLEIGKGRVVKEGSDVALLSLGAPLAECLAAAEELELAGVSTTVADARFAKPLDTGLIDQLVRHHGTVVTVEHGAQGGFGAMVLHYLANSGQLDGRVSLRTLTLPDRFIDHASPEAMYRDAGLTRADICRVVHEAHARRAGPVLRLMPRPL
jgi:1-deoxy-D-xylulose-5-phosphate synthase